MAGNPERYLRRARSLGCDNCRAKVEDFYSVEFYFLPTKLVRKRHRDLSKTVIYCRDCYEQLDELPFLVDGERRASSTKWKREVENVQCPACGRFPLAGGLHAVIASTLWNRMEPIDGSCWAVFCGDCAEDHRIDLPAKLLGLEEVAE